MLVAPSARWFQVLGLAALVVSLVPLIGISIGGTTLVLAPIMCLPFWLTFKGGVRRRHRGFLAALLYTMILIELVAHGPAYQDRLEQSLATAVLLAGAFGGILAGEWLGVNAREAAINLVLAAVAINLLVCVVQIRSFSSGSDLLAAVYAYSPFPSPTDDFSEYIRSTRRVYGLYPEPSAMGAVLVPWVLAVFATSPRLLSRRKQALVHGSILVTGLLLVFAQSASFIVLAVGACGIVALRRGLSPARILVATTTVIISMYALGTFWARRGGFDDASSWHLRVESIRRPIGALMGSSSWGTGVGLGASDEFATLYGYSATYSVLGQIFIESGVLVSLVVLIAIVFALKPLRSSPECLVVALAAVVSITLVTSYLSLVAPWIAFGFALSAARILDSPESVPLRVGKHIAGA